MQTKRNSANRIQNLLNLIGTILIVLPLIFQGDSIVSTFIIYYIVVYVCKKYVIANLMVLSIFIVPQIISKFPGITPDKFTIESCMVFENYTFSVTILLLLCITHLIFRIIFRNGKSNSKIQSSKVIFKDSKASIKSNDNYSTDYSNYNYRNNHNYDYNDNNVTNNDSPSLLERGFGCNGYFKNSNNRTAGYARQDSFGNILQYDAYGRYIGYSRETDDDGNLEFYDNNNRFIGYTTGDEDSRNYFDENNHYQGYTSEGSFGTVNFYDDSGNSCGYSYKD